MEQKSDISTNQSTLAWQHDVAKKWQATWAQEKIFDAHVKKGTPKFFCNFPYPYINAYQHIGHLYTLMRVDALARYKRQQGFNVLFPQGWHITGSPIVNAAKRVKAREPKQIKIMQDMGFSEKDFSKFENPEYWLEFFAPEFKKDYQGMGMSIDWTREFHTTSLNAHYDAFIKWQFHTLKEKGYVIKGKFPVVWDPKDNCAVGDHDRIQGEGETPQEFLLVKHKLPDGRFLVSATLRPDTILGITNLYVHPTVEYQEIVFENKKQNTKEMCKETWIVSTSAAKALKEQGKKFTLGNTVSGKTLIGLETQECDGHNVPVLPATFLDENFGTGLVHSVPSDSADDLIALLDLQKDEKTIKKYELDEEKIKAIVPIPVLDTPGYGNIPAQKFLDNYKIKSQNEREKLDSIKKELYKLNYYTATYNEKYKTFFSKNLHGKKVEEGKKLIQQELIERGWADTFYQLTGKVVTRSLTEAIVKIVDDQWFIDYANPEWKQQVHECLEDVTFYPEKARAQFVYTVDWLREWACTREEGLGTRLPWDEKWLIESLSDSTIYMSYYTIKPYIEGPIQKIDSKLLDSAFFDYVLLGKGKKPNVPMIEEMRESFQYWYPVDFRNSGKDLIQNHLTFFLFTHVAIFPKAQWPKGIGANGWVTVDGQKMSKSLGNMIPVRDVAEKFGSDASRITILYGGEGLDDPNWDSTFAHNMNPKLKRIYDDCIMYGQASKANTHTNEDADKWFASKLNQLIKKTTEQMEVTNFRSALQVILFDMTKAFAYYKEKTENLLNRDLARQYARAQTIMLGCFAPHTMEEAWVSIRDAKDQKFVSFAPWPTYDESVINEDLDVMETQYADIVADIKTVLQLAKITKPKRVVLYLAADWKYTLVSKVKEVIEISSNPKDVIANVMADDDLKKNPQTMKILPGLLKDRSKLPQRLFTQKEERHNYERMIENLRKEFSCSIDISDSGTEGKAAQGMPGKPAIFVE